MILSARKNDDVALINELPSMPNIGLVLIDDFHKLADGVKNKIADYMKRLADEGSEANKVVVIGINKAGQTLIHFAADLTGRIDTIQFEANPIEKVLELIGKGEDALNIRINIKEDIGRESHGSFHISQMLCHRTCLETGILQEQPELKKEVNTSVEIIRDKILDDLFSTFADKAKRFATGPRLRQEGRAPYFFLLKWLSSQNEWSLDIGAALKKISRTSWECFTDC